MHIALLVKVVAWFQSKNISVFPQYLKTSNNGPTQVHQHSQTLEPLNEHALIPRLALQLCQIFQISVASARNNIGASGHNDLWSRLPSPDKPPPPSENFFLSLDIVAEKSESSLQPHKMVSSTALTSKVASGSPYQLDKPQVYVNSCHRRWCTY